MVIIAVTAGAVILGLGILWRTRRRKITPLPEDDDLPELHDRALHGRRGGALWGS